MLVRKATYWEQSAPYVEPARKEKVKSPDFILDVTPNMRECVVTLIFGVILGMICLIITGVTENVRKETVQIQEKIVFENRMNYEYNLELAELKSPTRIQKIAQEKLGMVLPDNFVYTTKNTVEERKVTTKKDIRE